MEYRFKTPPIPPEFHKICHDKWRNVSSFDLGNRHLFGNETLFGDWDGDVLLILQNFAPESYVEGNIRSGHPCPYSHKDDAITNIFLRTIFQKRLTGRHSTECGVLCVNATQLINEGSNWSPYVPAKVIDKSLPVLDFVVTQMAKTLKLVICCGSKSQNAWSKLEAHYMPNRHNLQIVKTYHPAARVSNEAIAASWAPVAGALERLRPAKSKQNSQGVQRAKAAG